MRTLRGALVGALAITMTAAIPPAAGLAAPTAQVTPTAPYSVFTVDGGGKSYTLDPGNSTFQLTNPGSEPGEDLFHLVAQSTGSSVLGTAIVKAPAGTQLVAGQQYQTTRFGDATHAGLDVGIASTACLGSGTMQVREIVRDETTDDVTKVAISYRLSCSASTSFEGELRYDSSVGYQSATVSPMTQTWGEVHIGESSSTVTATVTGTGSSPLTLGAATIVGGGASHFSVVSDNCVGQTLAYGQTCTVGVRATPSRAGVQQATLVISDDSFVGARTVPLSVNGRESAKGAYVPISPRRVMDTRSGLGGPQSPFGAGATRHLTVGGTPGLPANGVGAVVLNVTVTGPTGNGHLTLWPYGVSRPTASSLNFAKGWTRANSVTVGIGSDRVSIYNSVGSTHVIVDVIGYYVKDHVNLAGAANSQLIPVVPERILDTRIDFGEKLPAGWYVTIPVSYGPILTPKIRALMVNVTAVQPNGKGHLTAWDGNGSAPNTSVLNYTTGSIVPNMAVVPVGPCYDCGTSNPLPSISVYTNTTTHILVDIVALFDDGTTADGLRFRPRTPARILDTRSGLGHPQAISGGGTATITTPGAIATADTEMLSLNVTAVRPTNNTYLTIWPNGISSIPRPTVSNLNPAAGQVVANAATTLIGPTNAFNVFNQSGSTDVIADVVGTFWLYPGTASGFTAGQPGLKAGTGARSQPQVTLPGPVKRLA